MPSCTLTLKNETANRLTYVETSPHDPQVKSVDGGGSCEIVVNEVYLGAIHVIVCEGYIWDTVQSCMPGQGNQVHYTVPSLGTPTSAVGHKFGNAFTADVTNNYTTSIYCVLAGPGAKSDKAPVPKIGGPTSLSIQTTGDIKVVFFVSLFGETTFPFVQGQERITVVAKTVGVNDMPTVTHGPTAPGYSDRSRWLRYGAGVIRKLCGNRPRSPHRRR